MDPPMGVLWTFDGEIIPGLNSTKKGYPLRLIYYLAKWSRMV
jgi:hypothetical protein